MELLITPQEVKEIAFPSSSEMESGAIGETAILSAQRKFLKPVFGDLYDSLTDGKYPEFLAGYVKPALAHYVKLLMLPALAADVSRFGIVRHSSDHMKPADGGALSALVKSVRSDASVLLRRAVDHVEADPLSYPEYRKEENVLHRVNISSGIVI